VVADARPQPANTSAASSTPTAVLMAFTLVDRVPSLAAGAGADGCEQVRGAIQVGAKGT
jgi:hypothetical protein